MLLGMAQGQVAAVAREVGHVLLYVPVVRPDEFDVAISYLVRRLEENASGENVLSAAFDRANDTELFARERDRYVASLARAADPRRPLGSNRTQEREADTDLDAPRILREPPAADQGLTQAVLGIARSSSADSDPGRVVFGGEAFVETAVFSPREGEVDAVGAPG